MSKNLKTIIIILVILIALALIIFNWAEIGAVIAAMAGGMAAFKAKLFNSSSGNVADQIAEVESEHALKREEWSRIKEEYDSKFNALKARMDYLDFRSAKISSEILALDEVEKQAIKDNRNLTENEILERLRNL